MNQQPNLEISNLISPLVDTYKFINAEWVNFFEIGLSEYIYNQTYKYYFTNTFLHRGSKVRFNEIYYPIKCKYKDLITDFSDLNEILIDYKNITIVGSGGSGKTTLIKHIFLKTLAENKQIPILIELRNLNDYNGDLESLISEKILNSKIKPNEATFKRTLNSGKFFFLLDGYDEIFSNKKQQIIRQIELFVDSYSKNNFLITTRPGSGIENFPSFYDFKVRQLDDTDVINFISKMVHVEEREKRIKSVVLDRKNKSYYEFLRNPLLLSMFIIAFENHPEIPKRKSAFYRNVYDTLYSRHDGVTKNSFPREKLTRLQREDFENILSIFSYLTLLDGRYSFTYEYLTDILNKVKISSNYNYVTENIIYDLRTSISLLILDGFEYYFPHRSIQEYFTALFISNLPSNKKKKAYDNLSGVLKKSSTDDSFNFWSLCLEMDNVKFISAFLNPQLKRIYKILENKNEKDLVVSYFKMANPRIWDSLDEQKIEEIDLLVMSNFENRILSFCDIDHSFLIWNFPSKYNCEDEFLGLYKRQMENAATRKQAVNIHYISKNQEMIDFFVASGIIKVIEEIRTKIKDKIIELDKSIKQNKAHIDDLLG